MKTERTGSRIHAAVRTGLFMGLLCLPLVSMVVGWGRGPEIGEKRTLAAPPARPRTLAEWKAFPRSYEAYFNDSFGWRNWLIMGRGLLVLQGWVNHPDVLYDVHSRMLYYRPNKASGGHHSTSLDVAKRERVLKYFRRTAAWAETNGIVYQMTVVPSRLTVYPEGHPLGRHLQGRRLLEDVGRKIRPEERARYLDVTDTLVAHRRDPEAIYYKFDTHWTDHGARLAYVEILRGLKTQGLDVEPFPESAFRFSQEPMPGDITGLLGINSLTNWLEVRVEPVLKDSSLRVLQVLDPAGQVVSTVEDSPEALLRACRESRQFRLSGVSPGPRALVVRDSFTIALVPYLAEHFSEATFVRTIPGEYCLKEWVERIRPDVVLEIFGEINVMRY